LWILRCVQDLKSVAEAILFIIISFLFSFFTDVYWYWYGTESFFPLNTETFSEPLAAAPPESMTDHVFNSCRGVPILNSANLSAANDTKAQFEHHKPTFKRAFALFRCSFANL